MSTNDEIASAVIAFRDAAIAKGSDGSIPAPLDHALHATMAKAITALHHAGPAGATAIRALADDASPDVRGWAAAELLSRGNTDILPIVEALAARPGLLGFNAQMVLKEFHAGRLKSPFLSPAR